MATRPKFAKMANYSCECVECESQFGECRRMYRVSNVSSPGKRVGECWANVSSPGKVGWPMSANVSSPANFPKWPFWRVLKFAKNGKFLASTQIQQIRRRVAIAYFRVKKNIGYDSMKCNNPYSLNEKQNTIILISFEIRFCTLI